MRDRSEEVAATIEANRSAGREPLAGFSAAERSAILSGSGRPTPPAGRARVGVSSRPRVLRLDGPSPLFAGRRGVSRLALEVFAKAQAAGGEIDVHAALSRPADGLSAGRRPPLEAVREVLLELTHFGLVERVGAAGVRVAEGFENAVIPDNGW